MALLGCKTPRFDVGENVVIHRSRCNNKLYDDIPITADLCDINDAVQPVDLIA